MKRKPFVMSKVLLWQQKKIKLQELYLFWKQKERTCDHLSEQLKTARMANQVHILLKIFIHTSKNWNEHLCIINWEGATKNETALCHLMPIQRRYFSALMIAKGDCHHFNLSHYTVCINKKETQLKFNTKYKDTR